MATLKNTTIDDTGYFKIATGTTAQRPASPVSGDFRYNTTLASLEFYTGSTWSVIGLADGSSAANAPVGGGYGCKQVLSTRNAAGLSSPDGIYWINPANTGAYQVYCDMTSDGGGWTLVMTAQDTGGGSGGTLVSNRDAIIAGTFTTGDSSLLTNQTLVSKALYQVTGDNILVREQGRTGWIKGTTNYYNTGQQCLNDGQSRSIGYYFAQNFGSTGVTRRVCNQGFSSPAPTSMWAYYAANSNTSIAQYFEFMMQENAEAQNFAFLSVTTYPGIQTQNQAVTTAQGSTEEGDQGFIVTDTAWGASTTDYGSGTSDASSVHRPGAAGHLFIR